MDEEGRESGRKRKEGRQKLTTSKERRTESGEGWSEETRERGKGGDHPTVNTAGNAADFNVYFSPSTSPRRPTLRLEPFFLPSHPSLYPVCA